MKIFGITLTMVTGYGFLLVLHGLNQSWLPMTATQQGPTRTVIVALAVVAAVAFALAGLAVLGKLPVVPPAFVKGAAVVGGVASLAGIAIAGHKDLVLGYPANVALALAPFVMPKLLGV